MFSEILSIEVTLKNPLSVALTIDDVFPLWVFTPESQDGVELAPLSNESNAHVISVILFFLDYINV